MDKNGRVEVVCGPMFAGKTEELLRRVRRAQIAGRSVAVVSHALDLRRGTGSISSHSGLRVPSLVAASAQELEDLVADGLDMVAIDEAQFFGAELVALVMRLAERGLTVIVAGLDVTFDAQPFEPLPSLMALAESVTALTAICSICGEEAAFHQRKDARGAEPIEVRSDHVNDESGDDAHEHGLAEVSGSDAYVRTSGHVGGTETYEARCRAHLTARRWWT